MVNLLFISSNSKAEFIKTALQPVLKVRIDVVGDFDYGLKEVFEKRPSLVFIQDLIAGVTGESVARHIQMLLGSGAPSFIFMHEGNPKVKPIKGLYEYLIDLSQDNSKLVADIQSTLKSLLGPQWQKIYVPPKANKPAVKTARDIPEGDRAVADQLVDDFITDLGSVPRVFKEKAPCPDVAEPNSCAEDSLRFVSSTDDQLDEILAAAASELNDTNANTVKVSDSGTKKTSVTPDPTLSADILAPTDISLQAPAPVPIEAAVNSNITTSTQPVSPTMENPADVLPRSVISGKTPTSLISPADFRIEKERIATEASLRSFEAEYLSKTASRKWYQLVVVVLVLCLIGICWFLLKQKKQLLKSTHSEPSGVIATVPAAPSAIIQESVSSVHRSVTAELPSFIPLAGFDRTFSSQKPGWDRYVGIDSEFRVFRSAGKLKAVQVLASKGNVISDSILKRILLELTGSDEYRITSREHKLGFKISRATINQKADLLIYRKRSSIQAVVISLD